MPICLDGALWEGGAPLLSISIPFRPFNSQNARGEARTRDVFINLKDPGARRTVRESDACPGDPGQSGRWICQPSQPPKMGPKAVRNECSAYIYWGEGTLDRGAKTGMYDEMLQESS